MESSRKWLTSLLLLACVCSPAGAGTPAEEAAKIAPRIQDYYFKHQIIRIGLPAVEPLCLQLAQPKDEKLAFETRSALRWIAEESAASPAGRQALVGILKQKIAAGQPVPVRCLAIELLAGADGKEACAAIAPLLSDAAVCEAACGALTQVPGEAATAALVHACENASPAVRCSLLHALGARRDPKGMETIEKAIADKDENVSLSAIRALGEMGDPKGAGALENLLKSGSQKQKAAASEALLAIGAALSGHGKTGEAARIFGRLLELADSDPIRRQALAGLGRTGEPSVAPVLDGAMQSGSPAVKSAAQIACVDLADALWEKGQKEQASKMFLKALDAASDDAGRMRALVGCGRAGSPDSIPKMAALLNSGSPRVQAAAAAAIKLIPGKAAADAMAAALPSAPPAVQAVLLTALSERHDAGAVEAMGPLAASANQEVALAAVKALGSTGSAAAMPALAAALEKGSDRVKARTVESCLNLARALIEKEDLKSAGQIYARLLDFAKDESVRTQVFAGMAKAASPDLAAKIEPLLSTEKGEAKEQAVRAMLACADKAFESDKKEASKPLYQSVLKAVPASSLEAAEARYRLSRLGEKPSLEAKDGIVGLWWIVGPWSAREPKDWKKPQGPEKDKKIDLAKEFNRGSRTMRWMPVMTDDKNGAFDMNRLFTINDNCLAYCYCEITLDKEQDVSAEIQSDDGHLLFVNGKFVHEFLKDRKREKKDNMAKFRLNAGTNQLLLKSCECSGNWTFSVRLTDSTGKPLTFKIQ